MSEHESIDAQENLVEFEHHRLNSEAVKSTRPRSGSGLKDAAMSIARKIDGAARTARISTLPARRKTPSFRDHALFQSMQKYRLIGRHGRSRRSLL